MFPLAGRASKLARSRPPLAPEIDPPSPPPLRPAPAADLLARHGLSLRRGIPAGPRHGPADRRRLAPHRHPASLPRHHWPAPDPHGTPDGDADRTVGEGRAPGGRVRYQYETQREVRAAPPRH